MSAHVRPAERQVVRPTERQAERQAERVTDRERRLLRERRRSRTHGRRLPQRGSGDLRAGFVLPLLDTEALSLEVHHTWHTLFPDTTDLEDLEDLEDLAEGIANDVIDDLREGI